MFKLHTGLVAFYVGYLHSRTMYVVPIANA